MQAVLSQRVQVSCSESGFSTRRCLDGQDTSPDVQPGLPPAVANELAAQTVLGAAKLVQETGEHPEALKEAVASPGGTTVAGLAVLEGAGLRETIVSAVRAAAARSAELSEG